MADPIKIKLPQDQRPAAVLNFAGLAQEREKEYASVQILKQQLEQILTRLQSAAIP